MKIGLLLAMLLSSSIANASDDWLCKSQSSVKYEASIDACGIGQAATEGQARLEAFDNARQEFNKICKSSDDCDGYKINAVPKRTTCEESKGSFKCYRLIQFNIIDEPGNSDTTAVQSMAKGETFVPFNVESIKNIPKVRRGMSKKQVLATFGEPVNIRNVYEIVIFEYSGVMCKCLNSIGPRAHLHECAACEVRFQNSKVYEWSGFKMENTSDLEDDLAKSQRGN